MNLLDIVNVLLNFQRLLFVYVDFLKLLNILTVLGSWKILKFGGFAKDGFQIKMSAKVIAIKGISHWFS